jgi:hypothetical protein
LEEKMNASDECSENVKILERGFDAFLDGYREGAEIWKTLETKAQGLITTAGLFLAAAFAFSREPSVLTFTKVILLVTLICLLWAIMAALSVLRTAEFQLPDAGDAVAAARAAVNTPMNRCGERYENYLKRQLEDADHILASLDSVNDGKRDKLETAQTLLAVAGFLAVAATLINMVFVGRR